ncbi:MAG: DNA polymerase III subunit epsilon [Roseovarius sp.]|nr:DNA polymerase III subunit epsilon [Roseovarius sp.]
MREIVLDTETTGFEPSEGHRIVEIGALELYNHMPTGRRYHQYINPERDMPEDAFRVHGIGPDLLPVPRPARAGEVTLKDKPLFAQAGPAFLEFVGDARLVIHNAAFDMKFLNAELTRAGLPDLPFERAVDTLAMARQKFPGAPASLDALCRRFAIDNSGRALHGALLDAQILAEVYLELIGGRQPDFALTAEPVVRSSSDGPADAGWRPGPRPRPLATRLTDEERAAHAAFVARMGDAALWSR